MIYAPNQDRVFYDGNWPFKSRSFPCMQFKCYDHPRDPIGISETTMDQHVQIVSNALFRRAYDSIMAAPNVVVMAGAARLKNAAGEAFVPTDEPWQFAYFDEPGATANAFQHFQAQPVPAGLFQMIQVVQQNFRADIGTAEVSSASQGQDIKNVPVGTIKAFVESGSIPTDHKIRRLRRGMSIFLSVLHDMQRSTYTFAKWVRLRGANGQMIAKRMLGSSLPGVDVISTAEPEFKAMTQEELGAIDMWMNKFGGSEAIAEMMHIPPSMVRKLTEERAKAQQAAQAAAQGPGGPMGAPAPGQPPGGQPGGPPPAPQPPMNGNGGGPQGAPNIPPLLLAALLARQQGSPGGGMHSNAAA